MLDFAQITSYIKREDVTMWCNLLAEPAILGFGCIVILTVFPVIFCVGRFLLLLFPLVAAEWHFNFKLRFWFIYCLSGLVKSQELTLSLIKLPGVKKKNRKVFITVYFTVTFTHNSRCSNLFHNSGPSVRMDQLHYLNKKVTLTAITTSLTCTVGFHPLLT